MKILVLNCGSSSIKYKLFEMESKEIVAQGVLKNRNERFFPQTLLTRRTEGDARR